MDLVDLTGNVPDAICTFDGDSDDFMTAQTDVFWL